MGDEERLHGDGDEERGVLHNPMHDATVDVYVFPLAGLVAAGGALPADVVECDGGEPRHFNVVVLMILILPFTVADHVVAVISRDGDRQLANMSADGLLVREGAADEPLAAGHH